MIAPKSRISKKRQAQKRAHWKLDAPNLVRCPKCHALKMQHKVCPDCGTYKGIEVLKLKEVTKKEVAPE
jgi:large subunit ribosomal protein L32